MPKLQQPSDLQKIAFDSLVVHVVIEAMPELKQPTPLQHVAGDVLFTSCFNFCNKCITDGSLTNFCKCIAFMKEDVCPHIPWQSRSDFHQRFLNELLKDLDSLRPRDLKSYIMAAYDIIMDRKIVGLKCVERMLCFLDPDDAHRIKGLKELEIPERWRNLRNTLERFHLEDVTSLTFRCKCTDIDLRTIANNCPKLEHLDIRNSQEVTDEGLRALSKCAPLRDLCVSRCTGVSSSGINEFLSTHKNLRRIFAWDETNDAGFDCFSQPNSLVYPNINEFTIALDRVSNEHISIVAKKFPNLTSFGISGKLNGDLSLLKNLDKLSQLNFCHSEYFLWDNLRELLKSIGGNILYLDACTVTEDDSARGFVTQSDFDFLYKFCENLEFFKFVYRPPLALGEVLVIPPFKKLKVFENHIPDEHAWLAANVEFGEMLELQNLTAHRFHLNEDKIKSIINDETCKFPKLKFFHLSDISCFYDIDYLNDIVRVKNLDLYIQDD